jgi:CheY-like chemotaxis protein
MGTLLVLEDEPAVRQLLRHLLKQYTLIEAATAEEALRSVTDHGHRADLLVADVTLPQSSGIQVALLLRIENPDLPVILTSGYPVSNWSEQDYTDLLRLGTTSVALLSKPFQGQELLRTVHEMIGAAPSELARTASPTPDLH